MFRGLNFPASIDARAGAVSENNLLMGRGKSVSDGILHHRRRDAHYPRGQERCHAVYRLENEALNAMRCLIDESVAEVYSYGHTGKTGGNHCQQRTLGCMSDDDANILLSYISADGANRPQVLTDVDRPQDRNLTVVETLRPGVGGEIFGC